MLYFLEIEKTGSGYKGKLHQGNPNVARPIPELKLGPDETVSIRGQEFKLGDLVKALVEYNQKDLKLGFDEYGQKQIGEYLYSQIAPDLPKGKLERVREQGEEVRIHIISKGDEHICRLPWVLLSNFGHFLFTENWYCTLSTDGKVKETTLSPSPKVLVIAPEPKGNSYPFTHAEQHLRRLEKMLCAADPLLCFGRHLVRVDTWEKLCEELENSKPHVLYYYGHGTGDMNHGRLVFASAGSGRPEERPIKDLAHLISKLNSPPCIAYINCCLGDAAGYLGAGNQLGKYVPAVITNRTYAITETAQAQAEFLLQQLLLKGLPPHRALIELHRGMEDRKLSSADVRWMTPILYCRYSEWHSNPPRNVDPAPKTDIWRVEVDRSRQYNEVYGATSTMLEAGKPKSVVFIWYGKEGEGIDAFHERLNIRLARLVEINHLFTVWPIWPDEYENENLSFKNMLAKSYHVSHFEDISAKIRSETKGAVGSKQLTYIRHEPVRNQKIVDVKRLKNYLIWWSEQFVPTLEKNQHALLGISFIDDNPPAFREKIKNLPKSKELDFRGTKFHILDEMEVIAEHELLHFLDTHDIKVPESKRTRVVNYIIEKSGGHYERTIRELEELIDQAWYLPDKQ